MKETPRDKFVRLATKRVNNAIKTIQLLGNLSNTSNYSYNRMDIEKIFKVLDDEMNSTKRLFLSKEKIRSTFHLDE